MAKQKHPIYPLNEAHVRLGCDGQYLHIDGLPSGPDSLPLPEFYRNGLIAIFNWLEGAVPAITCISVLGIWTHGEKDPFCAFDLWVQTGEQDGFYLSMPTAAALFGRHGIPYYRHPSLVPL